MKTSNEIGKFAPAFLAAQRAIKFAVKDSQNAHFKNSYADLSSVVDAVKAALNDAEITYIQSPCPSEDDKLHLETRLLHSSGEWMEGTLVMPISKQDPQGFGSGMTYARRYHLAAMTGLYQDDDDGNAGSNVSVSNESRGSGQQNRKSQPVKNHDEQPDAALTAVMEQMRSAPSTPELVKMMNSLTKEQKAVCNDTFNARMKELKKAA